MSRSEPLRLPGPAAAPRNTAAAPAGMAEAQLIGQANARRGLREGEPALRRARTAYLTTEWSGADDRRPEAGLLIRGRL